MIWWLLIFSSIIIRVLGQFEEDEILEMDRMRFLERIKDLSMDKKDVTVCKNQICLRRLFGGGLLAIHLKNTLRIQDVNKIRNKLTFSMLKATFLNREGEQIYEWNFIANKEFWFHRQPFIDHGACDNDEAYFEYSDDPSLENFNQFSAREDSKRRLRPFNSTKFHCDPPSVVVESIVRLSNRQDRDYGKIALTARIFIERGEIHSLFDQGFTHVRPGHVKLNWTLTDFDYPPESDHVAIDFAVTGLEDSCKDNYNSDGSRIYTFKNGKVHVSDLLREDGSIHGKNVKKINKDNDQKFIFRVVHPIFARTSEYVGVLFVPYLFNI